MRIALIVMIGCTPTKPTQVADADADTDDRDAAIAVDAPPDAPAPCQVRRLTFTSSTAVSLGCNANTPVTILDAPLPVSEGRILGRGTFRVRHVQTNVIHFWNVRVVVGDGATSMGLGDDVCPGASQARGNLGFGTVSAANNHARLVGHEGAAPCTPGALVVDAGATLDVWIEDARPQCAGKDMAYASYYLANGFTALYNWKTSMEAVPGVAASVVTTGAADHVRVMGVVEGSPVPNPNQICGSEASTLVMQTALDGAVQATRTNVVPASFGMGHLVLYTTPGANDADEVRTVAAGTHQAKLLVGSNFTGTVTTGGCCGDGAIAIVRE